MHPYAAPERSLIAAPQVAVVLDCDATSRCLDPDFVSTLDKADFLGREDLLAIINGLPGRPPVAGQGNAVARLAGELSDGDL